MTYEVKVYKTYSCEFEVEAENEEEARKFAEQLPVTSEDIIEDIRTEII